MQGIPGPGDICLQNSVESLSESHSPQVIQVACFSRNQASEYLQKSNFGRALAHLFVALRLIPSWKEELHSQFLLALSK